MSASRPASPKKSVAFDPRASVWEYTPTPSASKRSSVGPGPSRPARPPEDTSRRRSRSAAPNRAQQRASSSSPRTSHQETYPSHHARIAAIPGKPSYNRHEHTVLVPNDLIEIRIRTSKQRNWRMLQVPNLTVAEIMRSITSSRNARLAFVQYDPKTGEEERGWMSSAQQQLPIRRLKVPRDGFRFVIYE
ncbi:hypothetical protein AC578_3320 [Pseudocercospora eumusae]|uniref:Uncharacterized protein n=1 Tax=Pseudocercospora eumusae TaxID=321146 RepID=A0A139GU44_9PEZI|nr:hypothetical protein AC578_3320 [Pseudocercospora eumusae]